MSSKVLADVVDMSWHTRVPIRTGGPALRMALCWYADGTVRVEHRCDRGKRGVIICAPALQTGPHGTGHTVTPDGDHAYTGPEPTVSPSIACPDCGLHGFIRNGRWIPV